MTDKEFIEKLNNMEEIWKQLIYDGEYQNYDISNTGKIRNHKTCKEYKLSKITGMRNCYEFITITLNNGTTKNIGIHRLMAIMFIPIPEKYIKKGVNLRNLVVDHIDNIKYHNIIDNLQWLTQSENIKKRYVSDDFVNDILVTEETINDICADLSGGESIYEISKKYNVTESLVHDVRFKLRYTDISKDYKFPSRQISEDDARKICEQLSLGKSAKEVSDEFEYPYATVTHILVRNAWTHISKDYKFPNARTTDDVVTQICELLQDRNSIKEVSKITGVSKRTIEHIRAGRTHTDISKNYVFEYNKFKLPDKTVHNICNDLASKKFMNKEIAERNNVSLTFVKDIKRRKSRTDISHLYTW